MKYVKQLNVRITLENYQLLRLTKYYTAKSITEIVNQAITEYLEPTPLPVEPKKEEVNS